MMQNYHVWFYERTWRHASLKLFNPLHLFTKGFVPKTWKNLHMLTSFVPHLIHMTNSFWHHFVYLHKASNLEV
jgi:hypothetical protein